MYFLRKGLCSLAMVSFGLTSASGKEGDIAFVENRKQWPSVVLFRAAVPGGALFLAKDRFRYAYYSISDLERISRLRHEKENNTEYVRSEIVHQYAYDVKFTGSSADVNVSSAGQLSGYSNYFIGNDTSLWASGAGRYGRVSYKELYPGIDLNVYSKEASVKYDFVVAAGADAGLINLQFEGVSPLLTSSGDLEITTFVNTILEQKPYAFQDICGIRMPVACRYRLSDKGCVTFGFPRGYDHRYPLIIDPVLIFSTYSGSTGNTYAWSATYDKTGNLYAGGECFEIGWPVSIGTFQAGFAGTVDCGINKYSSDGSTLLYSTYYGGSDWDSPNSMVVNDNDELVMAGNTSSSNLAVTPGCFDNTYNGQQDIYVAHFNDAGTALIGATYIGGSSDDGTQRGEVLIGPSGAITVASGTGSANFPMTPGAYQTVFAGGFQDGVIFTIDPACSTLQFSTFLGGSSHDACYAVIRNSLGNYVICGSTGSTDFPVTAGAVQTSFQGSLEDAFVTVMNNTGTAIIASAYRGTGAQDAGYKVQVDPSDNILLCGKSSAGTYPVSPGVYFNSGGNVFIDKLTPDLTLSLRSTTLGSIGSAIEPSAFLYDICGNVYMCGYHTVPGLPLTNNAFQSSFGGFWICVLSQNMGALHYASYIGNPGDHNDGGSSRFDPSGVVYQSVCTESPAFPTTPSAYSPVKLSSLYDMASFKFDFETVGVTAAIGNADDTGCAPYSVHFVNASAVATGYLWDFGDGSSDTLKDPPAHVYADTGTYHVVLYAFNDSPDVCIRVDTAYLNITVIDTRVTAAAAASDDTGCAPFSVTFINNSTAGSDFKWDFGDGSATSTAIAPTHLFTLSGTYQVTLYAHNSAFCKADDTTSISIEVLDSVQEAGILLQANDSGCIPFTVLFDNNSTGATGYSWDFGDGTSSADIGPLSHVYSDTGAYDIILYAYNNGPRACINVDADTVSIHVFRINIPDIAVKDTMVCYPGILALTAGVTNKTPSMSYAWTPGSVLLSDPLQETVLANILAHSTFTVTVRDTIPGICSVTTSKDIDVSIFERPRAVGDTLVCPRDTAYLEVSGVLDSLVWSPGYFLGDTIALRTTAWPPSNMTYIARIYYKQCVDSEEVHVAVAPAAVIHLADSVRIYPGESYQMEPQGNCLYFSWFPPLGLSSAGISNPVAQPEVNTRYIINARTELGCHTTDSIDVYVSYDSFLDIPNAFTPGSGPNSEIKPVRRGDATLKSFRIFNRWGNKVFETSDIDQGWDGRFNGRPQPMGVYVYTVDAYTPRGRRFYKQGNITLIR